MRVHKKEQLEENPTLTGGYFRVPVISGSVGFACENTWF
jgi:hypothetical protein